MAKTFLFKLLNPIFVERWGWLPTFKVHLKTVRLEVIVIGKWAKSISYYFYSLNRKELSSKFIWVLANKWKRQNENK